MAKPASGTAVDTGKTICSDIVAVWPFYENTGLPKEILSNTSPSASANFSWSTGADGQPVGQFGSGGNTNLAYSSIPSIGPAMTIAVGIYMNNQSDKYVIIERELVDETWMLSTNYYGAGNIVFWGNSNLMRYQSNNSVISATTWLSFIVTDNGSTTAAASNNVGYLNGTVSEQIVSPANTDAPAANTNVIHIGNYDNSGWYFPGLIDYIFIWNRVLNATDAASIAGDPWQIFQTAVPPTTTSVSIMMDF